MKKFLFIISLSQSLIFASIENITPTLNLVVYDNLIHKDIEFYTKNMNSNINGSYQGLVVEELNITETINNEYKISLSILNYNNLISSLEIINEEGTIVQTYSIANNEMQPTSLLDGKAVYRFFTELPTQFFNSIKYESLNVTGKSIPYTRTKISFQSNLKNNIIRISYSSQSAMFYNLYQTALNAVLKIVNEYFELKTIQYPVSTRQLDTLISNFIETTTFKNLEAEMKLNGTIDNSEEIISTAIQALTKMMMEGDARFKSTKLIKKLGSIDKVVDYALTGIYEYTRYLNFKDYQKNTILGRTIYINLLKDKYNRGFWGLNNPNDITTIWKETEQVFPDVPLKSRFYMTTKNMFDKNIITGYKSGDYLPNKTINRAEFSKIIMNTTNKYTCSDSFGAVYSELFSDVKDDNWFSQSVWCAYNEGVLKGYEKNQCETNEKCFKPNNTITLAEAYKVSVLALTKENNFVEDDNYWWSVYLKYFLDNGISLGNLTLVESPRTYELTRGEMAQLVYGLCQSKDNTCK